MTDKKSPSNTVSIADPLTGREIYEKYCHDCANQGGPKCLHCAPPRNAFEWQPMANNIVKLNGRDTGKADQKQHELKVSGSGSLSGALVALMQGRDSLLVGAINFKIGEGWSLTDIVKRGEYVVSPGKLETFAFDGVPLVEFWPHETTMLANSLTITQKYRKLYSIKGVH